MILSIHWKNLAASDDVRRHLERRLGYALGRFGERTRAVWAQLSDLNGPRGGIDKRCRLQVRLRRTGLVTVDEHDSDIRAAVDRAADRLGRTVTRAIERVRDSGRGRRAARFDEAWSRS